MSPTIAASTRRAMRLFGLHNQVTAAGKIQKAVIATMATAAHAAHAPITAFTATLAKQKKVRKQAVGRSLGLVITQLRSSQAMLPAALTATGRGGVTPDVPDGAQFLSRRYRCVAGARRYKLYLPASQPKRPKGLIVMLHGCNQSPDDFATGTHMNRLAEKHSLAIAYPQQTRQNNAASCWNWFRPGDQAYGSGEPAILAALTKKLMQDLNVPRDRTFVAGLSAGGAMAAILVDEYPHVFAAAGIHSGLARGAAHDVVSAIAAMRIGGAGEHDPEKASATHPVRRIIFQGGKDSTVHPSNATTIVTAALGLNPAPPRIVTRSVRGRAYVKSTYSAAADRGAVELWVISEAGHAWSGGRKPGSYTDVTGPDASALMIRFFLAKPA